MPRRDLGRFLPGGTDGGDFKLRQRDAGIWAIEANPRLALAPTMPTRSFWSVAISPFPEKRDPFATRHMLNSVMRSVREKANAAGDI